MLQIFLRHSALYLAANLAARAVNFLALPIYARVFTPEEFGVYEVTTVFAGIAGLVIVLEVTQGLARFYPDQRDADAKRAYASSALVFTLAAYTVFVALCATGARPLGEWLFGRSGYTGVFLVALASMWSNGVCYLLQNQLRWQLRAREYAASVLTVALVSQGTAVLVILLLNAGLHGLFLGSFVGGLAGAAYAFAVNRSAYAGRPEWTKLSAMLRFSAPMMLSALTVYASQYIDRVAIRQLLGLEALGLYAVAARCAALATFILPAFQATLLPLTTTLQHDARIRSDLARIFRYFLACTLPLIFALAVFSQEILRLVAGDAYTEAHGLVPILALSILLAGMYVFAPGLWITKRTHAMLVINCSTAVLATVLNFVLIPALGLPGAALASLAGALLNFLAYGASNQRLFELPVPYTRIAISVAAFAPLAIAATTEFASNLSVAARAMFALVGALVIVVPLLPYSEARGLATSALRELRR